jgi:hypothetical protein
LEYLKDTEDFGSRYKEGEDVERFFGKLLSWVERRIFNRISKRTNFLLTRVNDQKIEIIADGNDDKNQEGNWREIISGDDLLKQRYDGTTWITVEKWHGS